MKSAGVAALIAAAAWGPTPALAMAAHTFEPLVDYAVATTATAEIGNLSSARNPITTATSAATLFESNARLASSSESPFSPDDFAAMANRVQAQFERIEHSISPSVVAISVAIEARGEDDTVRADDMTGRKLTGLLERTTRTVGTGSILSADGLILTNEHVVGEAQQIWVTTDSGKVYPAYVVASDPRQDIAILRMPAVAGLKPVTFAPADSVGRGHYAVAFGNPYGLANEGKLAMSIGEIAALHRSLPSLSNKQNRLYTDLIQTTAEINPGNSGGPLFDCNGRVIGIITAVVMPQKNTSGIGFALPISPSILNRINALKAGQNINYGDMGFAASQLSARQRRASGIATETGVRVEAVDGRGPSSSLREGDVLLTIDDAAVTEIDDFTRLSAALRAGVPTRLTFMRAGRAYGTTITPRRRTASIGSATGAALGSATGSTSTAVSETNQRFRWKGMLLGPIPANWDFAPGARPEGGLMVLASDTTARDALPAGTVVQSVGGRAVRCVADLADALATLSPEACSITLWSGTGIEQPKPLRGAGAVAVADGVADGIAGSAESTGSTAAPAASITPAFAVSLTPSVTVTDSPP